MKVRSFWLALLFAATVQAASPEPPPVPSLRPQPQQAIAARVTASLLTHVHYKPVPIDDAMSAKIFDRYLKSIDPERMFFVQSDIDQWGDARSGLGQTLTSDDLGLPFAIFNLYIKRAAERFTYARSLLAKGFDFTRNESFQYRRDQAPWPKNEDEARDLWRKRVKNDWLQLKLTGKNDKAIAETLDKRYDNFLRRLGKLKSDDAFQVFMNAYTMAVDPHTNYMGPRASEEFDIAMRLSLVGIGAVLQDKDGYVTIKELVAGGPAALSGKLKPGDRILGVAQGDKGSMMDVVGWRMDDTVALIRGAADSVVQLDILPAGAGLDGKHKLVSLVRKKINLEEAAAKKSLLTFDDGGSPHRVGVITLPTFYEDFQARKQGDRDYKSATRDVARLLGELKAEKVDSVLIDLRNNGGGSLTEAIELTGLFIDTGPVVQQRDAKGRVTVGRDTDPGVAWDGPMAVLINRGSASASEIFAAAIQDYRRGLVIGEPSFGKGTVQTVLNLNQVVRSDKPLGDVTLTVAQFFRIDGGTTQLRGVQPDIALPSSSDPEHFGESSFDNALPWQKIGAAEYAPLAELGDSVPILVQRHDVRVAKDKDYRLLEQDIAEINQRRKKNEISLNEAERRKERSAQEARDKLRSTPAAEAKAAADKPAANAAESDDEDDDGLARAKNARDVLLNEAARVLGDETDLLKARPELAARVMPGPPTRQ